MLSLWISLNEKADQSENDGDEFPKPLKIFLIGYAAFWGVYFVYMFYLSLMFMAMAERFMKDILSFTGRQLTMTRAINISIAILFNIGQFKFFMLNGIILIVLCVNEKPISNQGFDTFQAFCEYCETLLPLVLGVYLIYTIESIGFVTDDDITVSNSRLTHDHDQTENRSIYKYGGSIFGSN